MDWSWRIRPVNKSQGAHRRPEPWQEGLHTCSNIRGTRGERNEWDITKSVSLIHEIGYQNCAAKYFFGIDHTAEVIMQQGDHVYVAVTFKRKEDVVMPQITLNSKFELRHSEVVDPKAAQEDCNEMVCGCLNLVESKMG